MEVLLPSDVAVTPDLQQTESQESPGLPSLVGPIPSALILCWRG